MTDSTEKPAVGTPTKKSINQAKNITKLATRLLHDDKLKKAALGVGIIHVHMEDGTGYSVTISIENTPKP